MKIILSGGGTGGSVMPLLAVAEEIKKQCAKDAPQMRNSECEFLFIGTRKGIPEKKLVQEKNILYRSIYSGKLRRYFSFKNITDIFFILFGFIQSIFIILRFKPQAIFSAGGFVAVPLSLAGWFLRIPIFIHQQDIVPGLANKIIAPLSKKITVSFGVSLKSFNPQKTILTGNPVRPDIFEGRKERAIKKFSLEKGLPTLLIIGGGTGAKDLNDLIFQIVPQLTDFCQIIHLTGPNKSIINEKLNHRRYHQIEFLTKEIIDVYQAADLVVCRAGLGTLTELSVLKKPLILIPIPDSHQEANAEYFKEKADIVVLSQKKIIAKILLKQIKNLIMSPDDLKRTGESIYQLIQLRAGEKISKIILKEI